MLQIFCCLNNEDEKNLIMVLGSRFVCLPCRYCDIQESEFESIPFATIGEKFLDIDFDEYDFMGYYGNPCLDGVKGDNSDKIMTEQKEKVLVYCCVGGLTSLNNGDSATLYYHNIPISKRIRKENAATLTMAISELGYNSLSQSGLRKMYEDGFPGIFKTELPCGTTYTMDYFGFWIEKVVSV